ncbi:MAG: hypothetical protein M3Y60_03325 [Bacteroidota bacterium]|nr:hypothetical protein [Bacteroidota bacterium]
MKTLFKSLPILVVFAIASGFTFDTTNNTPEDKGRIEVSFNRKMEFNDLVKIKLDLAEAGITIQYRLLEFDEQGGLKALDFTVDCNDGFSGGDKSTEIFNQTRWGFYRDYRANVESPFGTGRL